MSNITYEMRAEQLAADKAYHDGLERRIQERAEAMRDVQLTKRYVMDGTDYQEKVPIPGSGYMIVRPLNDREYGQVQRSVLIGLSNDELKAIEEDLEKAQKLTENSMYLAVSMAIIDEDPWTPEEVGNLPAGAPDILYEVIAKISGFRRASITPGGK